MPHVVIDTVDQYEAVTKEIRRLTGLVRDTLEEQLRTDLIAAIEIWEATQCRKPADGSRARKNSSTDCK